MGSIRKGTKGAIVATAAVGGLLATAAGSAAAAAFALSIVPDAWLGRKLGGGYSRDENREMY